MRIKKSVGIKTRCRLPTGGFSHRHSKKDGNGETHASIKANVIGTIWFMNYTC